MSYPTTLDEVLALRSEIREMRTENKRLRSLIETLLDNDPDEPIADNGMTVLDGWQEEAKRFLKR